MLKARVVRGRRATISRLRRQRQFRRYGDHDGDRHAHCAVRRWPNSPVNVHNPAVPGELIYVYATGLGVPVLNGWQQEILFRPGVQYPGGGSGDHASQFR